MLLTFLCLLIYLFNTYLKSNLNLGIKLCVAYSRILYNKSSACIKYELHF